MASWHSRAAAVISDMRQEWLRTIILVVAVVVLAWLILYPLAILFDLGFRTRDGALTLANYAAVFTEPGLVAALVNSIVISTATTFFSILLGLPMAWGVSRTTMPGKQFIRLAVLVAFVM